ncbi:MAG: ABC transporter ATP-binding protein [Gorillibacterium sp.]|nr:ABC transporter ATP-binding protein [Gorillibacterium sp.]
MVLEIKKICKNFGGLSALTDVTFTINKGEIFGLIGPNGAGKTTAIRMMTGLANLSQGDIRVCGHSIRTEFNQAIVHVGAIIENPEFYPYMTGQDNLKQYMRMSATVTKERLDTVVRLVGLQDALDKKVKAYSLGMRQRLGIAQALLHKPSLLILDEPTNGLDPAGIHEMREYLRKIASEEGVSVLISSHLLPEVEQLCGRVVVIQNGKLITIHTIGSGVSGETEAQAGKYEPITLVMRVTELNRAQEVLGSLPFIKLKSADAGQGTITIELLDTNVPEAVAALTAEQVGIYRITEMAKATLEDEFLKWTGGNRIA